MNCPYCKVPLMGGMTTCPKCKYDTSLPGGGGKHFDWLIEHDKEIPSQLIEAYPALAAKYESKLQGQKEAMQQAINLHNEAVAREKALPGIMISSGFSFEGYRIVKYSGYISGDDAIQINRDNLFYNAGQNLTDALVMIRTRALKELKEAAYDLGCNAVIGVDFDYITFEPQTANISGGTTYQPYVVCVTANGNAVVIEKI